MTKESCETVDIFIGLPFPYQWRRFRWRAVKRDRSNRFWIFSTDKGNFKVLTEYIFINPILKPEQILANTTFKEKLPLATYQPSNLNLLIN